MNGGNYYKRLWWQRHLHIIFMYKETIKCTENQLRGDILWLSTNNKSNLSRCILITRVMTPMRSISLAGLLGVSFGVECPLGGDELASEEAVTEAVMDVPGWTLAKFKPSKLTLATLFSISSARNSVDSFSSWISLDDRINFSSIMSIMRSLVAIGFHPLHYSVYYCEILFPN